MALKENLEQIRTNLTDIKGTLYNKYISEENTKLSEITNKLGRVPTIYTPEQKTYSTKKYYTFNPSNKEWTEPEWNIRNSIITDLYLDIEDNIPINGFRAFMGYYQEGTIAYNLKSIHSSTGKLMVLDGNRMFLNCKNLKEIPPIDLSFSLAKSSGSTEFMFSGCENLEYVNLSGILGTHYPYYMFQNCKSLKAIRINATCFKSIPANCFNGCTSLKFIDFSQTKDYDNLSSINLTQCTAMLGEDLFRTLMTLPQNTKTDNYITIYLTLEQAQSLENLNIVAPYWSNLNGAKMYWKPASGTSYNELNIAGLIMFLKGFNFVTS